MAAKKVELYLAGAWVDITSYTRETPGSAITYGIQNEGSNADPNTVTIVVNNRDGRFTPRNSAGAYYGNIKRGTPLRITVGTTVRFVGELAEFPTRWEESGNDVYGDLVAAGLLRRMQHASNLASTLTSAVLSLSNIVGYWPVEDDPGATQIATPIVGGTPGTFTGSPVFSAVDLGAGTHDVATWATPDTATFTPVVATSTGFTAGFFALIPTSGLSGGEELFRVDVNGTAKSWRVLYSPVGGGGVFLQCIANDSAATEILASGVIAPIVGVPVYIKIEASNSGANVAWALSTLGLGGTTAGTIVGYQVGSPLSARIGAGTISIPAAARVAIGHVILASTSSALFSTVFDAGRTGYAGESVEARLSRIATLAGVTIAANSGTAQPVELGAQPDGTTLDVLRALEKADAGGILTDTLDAIGLTYITRNGRYNDLEPQLVLDYTSGHLSPPLEPTDDDQHLTNDVTATRDGGSSARAVLTSGALSTAAYPSGVGPYPSGDTYGVYRDTQLPYLAQWLLALGTIDETRFPAVTVDLVKNSSLVASAEALRAGSRLRITNLPAYAGATNVDLQVIGWRETITEIRRDITFVCTPGSIWLNVFELDDNPFGKLDDNRLAY